MSQTKQKSLADELRPISYQVKLCSFWEESVWFADGWFLYNDGKGHTSVVSRDCVNSKENRYEEYQAWIEFESYGVYSSEKEAYLDHDLDEYGHIKEENLSANKIRRDVEHPLVGDVIIPQRVGDFTINEVQSEAFMNCGGLTNITLPDGVTKIGELAFEGCCSLTSISIPDSVTEIHCHFSNCSNLTIHAAAGSYAEKYAAEHGLLFSTQMNND